MTPLQVIVACKFFFGVLLLLSLYCLWDCILHFNPAFELFVVFMIVFSACGYAVFEFIHNFYK